VQLILGMLTVWKESLVLLIGKASDLNHDELIKELAENSIDFECVMLVEVPSSAALTKAQYAAWNVVWPLAFFESMNEKYLTPYPDF
jgi:hypothetical protein